MEARAALHPCNRDSWQSYDSASGWTRIRTVVDSGSSDSCSPHEMPAGIESRESAGSRRWLLYNGSARGGKPLSNEGEKDVMMMTEDGKMLATCRQTVDVELPLAVEAERSSTSRPARWCHLVWRAPYMSWICGSHQKRLVLPGRDVNSSPVP